MFSLLVLQGLARLVRNPRVFTGLALAVALLVCLVSPSLWAAGVADGLWLPLRGLFNGNPDRGVQALFPLFPWLAFPAFGAFLGGLYRHFRVEPVAGRARWSEPRFLAALAVAGALLLAWGSSAQQAWLWGGRWIQQNGVWMLHGKDGAFTYAELGAIANTTLPSVAARLGFILLGGAAMGLVELVRPRWGGPNPIKAASAESLLLYMLHLNMLFSVLLAPAVVGLTGWGWGSLGWPGTLLMTAAVIGLQALANLGRFDDAGQGALPAAARRPGPQGPAAHARRPGARPRGGAPGGRATRPEAQPRGPGGPHPDRARPHPEVSPVTGCREGLFSRWERTATPASRAPH